MSEHKDFTEIGTCVKCQILMGIECCSGEKAVVVYRNGF